MRAVLGSIAGLIVWTVVNMGIISLFVRTDPSADYKDPKVLLEMYKSFTAVDFMIPLAAHILGLLAGLLVARAICKTTLLPIMVIASVHMAGTVINLYEYPHPIWFGIVDVIVSLLIIISFFKTRKT
ncbi:MAG: hypothetical protein ACI837_000059 [Crocinitomicaceae bacterium]|jgi:hypothetical protein